MAKGVRYSGAFLSKGGVKWKIDLLQEGYGSTTPVEISFPADCPLEIAYEETDKIKPVQSSNATLKIISDTDRQFLDLYSVAVGTVLMNVYRDGLLYWSGTLDTELYEEPYAYLDGYEVMLTFADFAVLERFSWTATGFMSIDSMLARCLSLSGITYKEVVKYISTKRDYSFVPGVISLVKENLLQSNFYDEEGEAMSCMKVLEAILQPFALRIIQKAGKVIVYDINAVFSGAPKKTAVWDAEDSHLSCDKVFNNVQVTFSPYADSKMLSGDVEADENLTDDAGGVLVKMSYEKNNYGLAADMDGFRIHHSADLKSELTLSNGAKFFQIAPIHSGSEATGVIMSLRGGLGSIKSDGVTWQILNAPRDCGTLAGGNINTDTIIKCPPVYLGYTSISRMKYKLKISLDFLWDVRYNPFEEAGDYNESGLFGNMNDWCNFAYVPIRLTLRSPEGIALYHYENYKVMESSSYEHPGHYCHWVAGEGSWGQAYLCYYDWSNRKSKTGLGGWAKNKQIIGYYRGNLPERWQTIGDGEFIDLPMCGGYLELEIGAGMHQFDYKREVKDIFKWTRWVAYKNPSITLCKKNYTEVETKDIVDSAWLNRAAKEELDIDTVVGVATSSFGSPNAKGQIFDEDYNILQEFERAGVTDRLERLLIGTIYSQYGGRKTILSGTVKLLDDFCVLEDNNTAGTFLLTKEIQNCIDDTSEIAMSEIVEDNYEGIEYE